MIGKKVKFDPKRKAERQLNHAETMGDVGVRSCRPDASESEQKKRPNLFKLALFGPF